MLYRLTAIAEYPGYVSAVTLTPSEQSISYQAGQYIELKSPSGDWLPYTIANAPQTDGQIELYIRHLPEDQVTQALIKQLHNDRSIEIKGPFGECIYQADCDRPLLLLAAGTGIAQAKALIEQAIKTNDSRRFHLYWGIRFPNECFLRRQLFDWLVALPHFNYHVVISRSQADADWQGKTGYIYESVSTDFPELSAFQAYLSGPWPMIDAALPHLLAHGLQRQYIYSDRFAFLPA
jgi:CDP-4-dehydro-6-deoxyglucose reductase